MTIINPKSITGVTSITTPSGSDNLFTVHTNNTTERIRINNDGDVIVVRNYCGSRWRYICNRCHNCNDFCWCINRKRNREYKWRNSWFGSTGTFTGDVSIADKIVHTGDTNTAIRCLWADIFNRDCW